LVGGLFIYSRLSFERGFADYIEQKETARNAKLISALENFYQTRGSWNTLSNNNRYWQYFVAQYTPQPNAKNKNPIPFPRRYDLSEFYADEGSNTERAEPPTPNPYSFDAERARIIGRALKRQHANDFLRHDPYKRYLLLDANKQLVAGKEWSNEKYFLSELRISAKGNRQIIGYLGTPLNPALRDLRDTEFSKRQQNHFLWMTITAIGFALICAIPLSHLLTTRVKKLAVHVQRLSRGDYAERISSRGKDEISILAQHLNHLAHSLEQSEQTRKRWVADISHELRTPLAVLQADLEALEDGVRQLDTKAITRLQKHAMRLTRLVNDLYELALTDIGDLSYKKINCNIKELVDELLHSLELRLQASGLSFHYHKTAEPLMLLADPERLQQLLLNLFNNSINYTQAPGQVELSVKKDADNILISLEDTAPGVNTELHEKLFERLFRGESSRSRETGGAGLGLSICRNIAAAHNGKMTIDHSQLGGLKVTVILPLTSL
jgi:two-component system, OmpR family, sensor histidine kinase BaeS